MSTWTQGRKGSWYQIQLPHGWVFFHANAEWPQLQTEADAVQSGRERYAFGIM